MAVNLQPNTSLLIPPQQSGFGLQGGLDGLIGLLKLAGLAQQPSAQPATAGPSVPPAPGQPMSIAPQAMAPVPADMAALYSKAEQQYPNIPQGYLATTAGIESRHNPQAYNEFSKAKGLFQFTDSTANDYGLKNPYDPAASTNAAAKLASDNAKALSDAGIPVTAGNLYLAHQQGAAGAIRLLTNPDVQAVSLVKPKAITQNGGNAQQTAGQFAQMWTGKFDNTTGPRPSTTIATAPAAAASAPAAKTDDAYFEKLETPADKKATAKSSDDESYFAKLETATPNQRVQEAFQDVPAGQSIDASQAADIKGTIQSPQEILAGGMKAQAEKADPYAGLTGLGTVYKEGGGEVGKTTNELIKWAKRNPEEAGALAALAGVGLYAGGRFLAPAIAAVPGISLASRMIGGVARSPAVQAGAASAATAVGLPELLHLFHGVPGAAEGLWSLITGGSH